MQNLKTDNNPIYDNVVYSFPTDWPSENFESVLVGNLPSYKKYKRKDIFPIGKIPVIDQGAEPVAGYINDETGKYLGNLPLIIFGDHTRNIKYIDFDFAVGADGTKLLKPNEQLIEKFFYYYLKSIFIPPSGYSRHYKYLKEIRVPIPDKNTQKKIVDQLDSLIPKIKLPVNNIAKARKYVAKFRQAILSAAFLGKLTEVWREGKQLQPADIIVKNLEEQLLKLDISVTAKNKYKFTYGFKEEGNNDDLPEGWRYTSLDKLCSSFQYGTTTKSNTEGKVPVLRMGNLQNGEIDWTDLAYTSDQQEIEKILLIYCPNILFPFARRIIANCTIDGNFPPLMLDPINFADLYQKRNSQMVN